MLPTAAIVTTYEALSFDGPEQTTDGVHLIFNLGNSAGSFRYNIAYATEAHNAL